MAVSNGVWLPFSWKPRGWRSTVSTLRSSSARRSGSCARSSGCTKSGTKQESGRYAGAYVQHFLEGASQPDVEFIKEAVEKLVPEITLEEINARAGQWITDENRVILVSGPETDAAGIPDESGLLAVFESAETVAVTPWVDQTRDAPLVTSAPSPGRVTETQVIEELGVTRWTLSNGAVVLIKPTDFKNDEILLRGTSSGGHSLVDNEDYITASQASSVLGGMGLGEFSQIGTWQGAGRQGRAGGVLHRRSV